MKKALLTLSVLVLTAVTFTSALAQTPTPVANVSAQTQVCLACHQTQTSGLVDDWMDSRHAKTTPAQAMKVAEVERRISATKVPDNLQAVAVGCYECHGLNAAAHKDNFDHFGYKINLIVTPNDCKTCHVVEVEQYATGKKANAFGNLAKNPVYSTLVDTLIGLKEVKDGKINTLKPSDQTKNATCYACHGANVTVDGMKTTSTKLGAIQVPNLTNWPNMGVGRVNPDGSLGSCTACHPRHNFSIEIARKPYTCAACHLEPDVPAWEVYRESKHGNIVFSKLSEMNWNNVPWRIGKDFNAPSCATCHASLITTAQGEVIAPRNHDFGARLWVRVFGLIYSHPQPKSGDTSIIKNKDGLPLPTTFTNERAAEFLIDENQRTQRQTQMQQACLACHSTSWVYAHFARMDTVVAESDKMTFAATQLLMKAWDDKLADKTNPFDEAIEQKWISQWLFYANSVRLANAMAGAPDYAAFKNGWWNLTNNLQEMKDWIELRRK
jgi:hypothetical protein